MIKNAKKMKSLSILYNYAYEYAMFRKIIKGLEQNLSIICKDSTWSYLKIWWFQENQLSWGYTSANLDPAKSTIFPKKNFMTAFFVDFGEFFQNRHKKQLLVNSSENVK